MSWADGATEGSVVAGGYGPGEGLHQLDSPMGLSVNSNFSILVVDSNNHRVMLWEAGAEVGTVVAGGNGEGSALHQLDQPSALRVNGDDFYIADTTNHRVVKWTFGATAGVVVAGFHRSGVEVQQLSNPFGVAVITPAHVGAFYGAADVGAVFAADSSFGRKFLPRK